MCKTRSTPLRINKGDSTNGNLSVGQVTKTEQWMHVGKQMKAASLRILLYNKIIILHLIGSEQDLLC